MDWEIKEYNLGFRSYENMSKAEKFVFDVETKYPGIGTIYYEPKDMVVFKKEINEGNKMSEESKCMTIDEVNEWCESHSLEEAREKFARRDVNVFETKEEMNKFLNIPEETPEDRWREFLS